MAFKTFMRFIDTRMEFETKSPEEGKSEKGPNSVDLKPVRAFTPHLSQTRWRSIARQSCGVQIEVLPAASQ
eukprot:5923012-Amphidinium_carterae.1